MRLYFAGPLFAAAERTWNEGLAAAIEMDEVVTPTVHADGTEVNHAAGSDSSGTAEE